MATITGHGLETMTVTNRKVKDLAMTFRLVNAAGTGSLGYIPTFRSTTCKAVLTRNGVDYTLFDDNLQNLGVFSHYHKGLEALCNTSYLWQRGSGQAILPVRIALPGPVDLQGNDKLVVEVQTLTGTYSSNFNVGQCVLDFRMIDSLGREEAIPHISVKNIKGAESTFEESLGSAVSAILVQNYDKGFGTTTAYTDAQNVFLSINLTSERHNLNETGDSLQSRLVAQFETPLQAILRGQGHYIQPTCMHKLMDEVVISGKMVPGNVTASENVIIWSWFEHDGATFVRAQAQNAEHVVKQQNKVVGRIGKTAFSRGVEASRSTARRAMF